MDFFLNGVSYILLPSLDTFSVFETNSSQSIDEDDYYSEQEFNPSSISIAKRIKYALCAYHKASQEYESYVQSLQPGKQNTMARPTY